MAEEVKKLDKLDLTKGPLLGHSMEDILYFGLCRKIP
jgi:hypothetical protein